VRAQHARMRACWARLGDAAVDAACLQPNLVLGPRSLAVTPRLVPTGCPRFFLGAGDPFVCMRRSPYALCVGVGCAPRPDHAPISVFAVALDFYAQTLLAREVCFVVAYYTDVVALRRGGMHACCPYVPPARRVAGVHIRRHTRRHRSPGSPAPSYVHICSGCLNCAPGFECGCLLLLGCFF